MHMRFVTRLLLLGVSIFLVLLVLFLWKSYKIHYASSRERIPLRSLSGIQPNDLNRPLIVQPKKDGEVPSIYDDFVKDPQGFHSHWKKVEIPAKGEKDRDKGEKVKKSKRRKTSRLSCLINNNTKVSCLMKDGEVYMPFSKFIKRYFEVYGDVAEVDSDREDGKTKRIFNFHHSIAPLWLLEHPYQPAGEFLFFKAYDVSNRAKVELISGIHGVPVSNQWDKTGYVYPIQVAQYGLSSYSKLLSPDGRKNDRKTIVEDGVPNTAQWIVPKHSTTKYQTDNITKSSVLYFKTAATSPPYPHLKLDEKDLSLCLSFDIRLLSENSSLSVVLEAEEGLYVITYTSGQYYKNMGVEDMRYGIGDCRHRWCSLYRDLLVDFKKFLPDPSMWKSMRKKLLSIQQIELLGEGLLDNVALSKTCHMGHFKQASDWLMNNQDKHGGWPVAVTRVITSEKLTLKPGWYSAMAQGQCISLMMRAYHTYNRTQYLSAAEKALNIYANLSSAGGVRAVFLGKYNWYEEYPTDPPLFVLNGFIYSLFGLYDLAVLGQGQAKVRAQKLFDDGMRSLKAMLPLFDSGTGTFYDLRHVTIPKIGPNRARGDYHAVHIAQLQNLATIDTDPIFNKTAARWLGYAAGQWSSHN